MAAGTDPEPQVVPMRRITCPRCEAPVTGDFKFCPSCAYRLHAGTPVEPETPARTSRLGTAVLLLGAGALLAGLVGFGVLLFGDRGPSLPTSRPTRLGRALTVRDIPDLLVDLPGGTAYWADGLQRVAVGPTRFLRYEVTRGQWSEFLRDLEAHPERVPAFLQKMWADPARDGYLAQYVDAWWSLAQPHLERATGRSVDRPLGLTPPLSTRFGVLCLVPPSWTYLTPFEEIAWRLPRDVEGAIPENLPVSEVSWFDAVAFGEWATEVVGVTLALPSEAEWRRAAHGNDPDREYPWGSEPYVYACNNLNFWGAGAEARPLGVDYLYSDVPGLTREGLYAMAGNVGEWINPYVPTGSDAAAEPPRFAAWFGGSFRRGLAECATWSQETQEKFARFDDVGFRLRAPPR